MRSDTARRKQQAPRGESVLMQDLCSSHWEVAMMTTTEAAGLSAAAEEGWSARIEANERVWTSEMSVGRECVAVGFIFCRW